jgi:hypothetical protein
MKTTLFLTCLFMGAIGANGHALTTGNFADLVTSTGKDSFIKFQAPW